MPRPVANPDGAGKRVGAGVEATRFEVDSRARQGGGRGEEGASDGRHAGPRPGPFPAAGACIPPIAWRHPPRTRPLPPPAPARPRSPAPHGLIVAPVLRGSWANV